MAEAVKRNTAPKDGKKEPFYLFNDEKSCRIDTIQSAMRGIGQLIDDEANANIVDLAASRHDIASIFALFAQSIEDVIGIDNRDSAYLDPTFLRVVPK